MSRYYDKPKCRFCGQTIMDAKMKNRFTCKDCREKIQKFSNWIWRIEKKHEHVKY